MVKTQAHRNGRRSDGQTAATLTGQWGDSTIRSLATGKNTMTMIDATPTDCLRIVADDGCVIADLEALQGSWTQDQYLAISAHTNHLIEFTDGSIEVLPMPTIRHQAISQNLLLPLVDTVRATGGAVYYGPLRLQVREGKFREPDLMLVRDAKDPRAQNAYFLGADLVMEIVSPDDPGRDIRVKRADYAEAGIPEYWIVNPLNETITVLVLDGAAYEEHGVFARGDQAASATLEGFAVEVSGVFDAG